MHGFSDIGLQQRIRSDNSDNSVSTCARSVIAVEVIWVRDFVG